MVLVALVTVAWSAAFAGARATYGARTTADEPQYLMTAISLAEDRSLDVADERADGRYRAFHEVGLPLQEELRPDGSRISPHDPLLPVLLAPAVAWGGWLAAKLTLAALAGALAAAMVWVAVRRFGVRVAVAATTVLAFALAAPLAVYSTQVYPEIVAALAVTVGVGAVTGPLRRAGLVTVAGAVVALPWLSVKYAPVAAVLAGAALVRLWQRGDRATAGALVGALVLSAVGFAVAHQAWYGGWTPYASGRHFAGGEATVMGSDPDYVARGVRLLGLLNDRGFGLAAWAPGFLLAVPAFAALARRRPPGAGLLGGLAAAGWLNATFVALTMHGWWWPGRQVVVVVPAIVLAVAWWAQQVRAAHVAVLALGALGALTAAWLAADVLSGHMTLVVDFERTTNPLYRVWRHALPDGRAAGPGTAVLRIVWLGVVAGLATLGWRSVGPRRATTRPPTPGLVRTSVPTESKELTCASSR
jgi:hypothetical protein